ncbi:signal peptide-containing [Cryptosporidium sp. chipmunk genotype I]|uniref:signal peptide-containing n=1 Tax=Cryptosporidium sp. chipmunk genotype I TaxID=1280935 RepID=UPI00351AA2E8|nr:signal peptide-containing [Cryptosporidium sp. chipmunk genotype I]
MEIKIYLLLLFCVKFAREVILTIANENIYNGLVKELGDDPDFDQSKLMDSLSNAGSDSQLTESFQSFLDISEEKQDEKDQVTDATKVQSVRKSESLPNLAEKTDLMGFGVSDSRKETGVKASAPDFKFGEPAPLIRDEELYMYEHPSEELILSIPIPTMRPEQQFNTIRRISGSKYKGLPKAHQNERTNVNWCRVIASRDPDNMTKANNMYRMVQVDLVSVLGGIGSDGSSSNQGYSGNKVGSGWTQQHICEGIYLLNTYRGSGDCERIFLDLLARFHGQWSLFFKMFRQKFRQICKEVGYSIGQWDVYNDRAYSQYTVLKSAKKPIKVEPSKERKEFIRLLRTRSGVCSLLSQNLREKAIQLKTSVENIPQIKHITQRISLSDYCDVILGKQSIIECAEALITFFKLKAETYYESTERYRSIRNLLIKACDDALFHEKDSNPKPEKVSQYDRIENKE